jgi:hypothetical protein
MWWWKRQERGTEPQPDAQAARDALLSAYLDSDLTPHEQSRFLAELDTDDELREALEGMREVKLALASLGELPAPRSFALAAAPVEEPYGPSRFELGARLGAIAAAVAFVLVVGADLRGGASEPVVFNTTGANGSLAGGVASDSAAGAREGFAAAPEAPVASSGSGESSGSSSSGAGGAAPAYATPAATLAPAAPSVTRSGERLESGTPTTMIAPATGATPPAPEATPPAGSAAPAASPAADEKAVGGGSGDAASNGVNPSSVEPATPVGGGVAPPSGLDTPTSSEAQPAAAPDAPVSGAGSDGNSSSAFAPLAPTVISEVSAPGLGVGLRVSVEQSAGLDAWRLAEVGLGALGIVLAAGAAGTWYMRHREGAGS